MRSIKFRSWNGKNFEYFNNGKCDCAFGWGEAQQFTGLVDKQGVEIYEGDIVDYYDEWKEEKGRCIEYTIECGAFTIGDSGLHFSELNLEGIEVIGNIYEHSHLLDS